MIFEKIRETFRNIHRVVECDEDLEWNRAVYKCTTIVDEVEAEYKDENVNIITDYLQFVRDNADNYDTKNGWSLADLIDLSIKFSEKSEYNNGWIPCSERLPEGEGYVLAQYTDGKYIGGDDIWMAFYNHTEEHWEYETDEGLLITPEVIAWQPLPEPYKKGE